MTEDTKHLLILGVVAYIAWRYLVPGRRQPAGGVGYYPRNVGPGSPVLGGTPDQQLQGKALDAITQGGKLATQIAGALGTQNQPIIRSGLSGDNSSTSYPSDDGPGGYGPGAQGTSGPFIPDVGSDYVAD